METLPRTFPTTELAQAGQSPWLDFISRELLNSGKMKNFIEEKGVRGVTSNPSIFEKAIGEGASYDTDIRKFLKKGFTTFEIYDALTVSDIQRTCDLFLPLFKKTQGDHGFVSLEVSPDLAYETDATIEEAKRLFKLVARPNVMIKIPATPEGIPAIRAVIGSGINVNVTLMFSMRHYQDVANAYVDGLADYQKAGGDVSKIYSVASVFVSRIDSHIDKKIEALIAHNASLADLKGKAAIANSKLIYQEFKRIFGSERFKKLQSLGAQAQKVLWGSTSAKNPAYSDLMYVENLVGSQTVNTMPMNTLEALWDHGIVRSNTIEENLEESRQAVSKLKEVGLDLLQIGETLQAEGVKAFIDSFDTLMRTLELKREMFTKSKVLPTVQTYHLSAAAAQRLAETCNRFEKQDFLSRFLSGDARLWKDDASHQVSIKNRLGWLKAPEWLTGKLYEIDRFCEQVRSEKISSIVLLGMGGSSLAPEVMSLICKRPKTSPSFYVLDTTDPASILEVQKKLNLKKTLFVVASKSGSTIETTSQFQYFYEVVQKAYGKKASLEILGKHFIAITDAGSSLEKLASEKKFCKIFINPSNIGGRFSALSFFGMVPAALLGISIRSLIQSARHALAAFKKESHLQKNSGVALGILIGELAKMGHDKVTYISSHSLASFGAWLEQLVAESTGKEGKGVIFVDSEQAAVDLSSYGKDRVFLILKDKKPDAPLQKLVTTLKKAGFPLIQIEWPETACLGEQFFKWEVATSVAGIILNINPFDEPNVKESKDNTAILLGELKKKGKFENPKSYVSVKSKIDFKAFFHKKKTGAYTAFLAFVHRSEKTFQLFHEVRHELRENYKMPALLGFGPRYLHSIGQLYKGGTPTGLFIAFLSEEAKDIKIPGAFYTFGQLKKAQALGDIQALEAKGLPVLTVDLGKNWQSGLKDFEKQLSNHLREL